MTATTMNVHQRARVFLEDSINRICPERGPSEQLLILLQAVGLHESSYGVGWGGAMKGSRNIGALQCGHCQDAGGNCGPGCRPATDSHSNGKKYGGCFKEYATEQGAWDDFVTWFSHRPDTLDRADEAEVYAFCLAMRKHGYFEARGTTDEGRAAFYAIPVYHAVLTIAGGMNENTLVELKIPEGVVAGA